MKIFINVTGRSTLFCLGLKITIFGARHICFIGTVDITDRYCAKRVYSLTSGLLTKNTLLSTRIVSFAVFCTVY